MNSHRPSYCFGPFRLEVPERRLTRGDTTISLRSKVFDTLAVLVENHGRLVRKEELMRALWGDTIVEENNLDHNISVLRKALGQERGSETYIETLPRQGYRFVAAVQVTEDKGMPAVPHAASLSLEPETFLIQRGGELDALDAEFATAAAGRRRLVFVTGEAGLGKTSVIQAFLTQRRAAERPCIGEGHCLEHLGAGEAYMPWLEAVSQAARGGGSAFLEVLKRYAPSWLLHFPSFLDAEELQAIRQQVANVTRERMLREMVEALECFTAEHPLIVVLEDLHWCDRSTLELMTRVARGKPAARLLLLATYRPEDARNHSHPLQVSAQELIVAGHAREVSVSFLSEESVAAYLAHRFGRLPTAVARLLRQRTDGNPLFVTTIVNSWVERGHLRPGDGAWELTVPVSRLTREVPESLTLFLDGQLQRLSDEERQVIEAAAVAGPIFASASVAAALEWSIEQVESVAVSLARRGQFFRRNRTVEWPDGTLSEGFGFLHSLYQEIVYERVPAGRRVRHHQQLGLRLERAFTAHEDEAAAELALHFGEARDAARGVRYHRRAAELALNRSAHPEAVFHLRKGLELVRRLPDLARRDEQEFSLQAVLGPALVVLHGFAYPEAETALRRAAGLASRLPDSRLRFPALYGLAAMLELRGNFTDSQALLQANLPEQERTGEFVADGLDLLACSLFHQGSFREALEHARRGAAVAASGRVLNACHGEHPVVGCETWAALSTWFLGYPDQALEGARRAVAMGEMPGRSYSLAGALQQLATMYQLRREPELCRQTAQHCLEVATQQGFAYRRAVALVLRGWASAHLGATGAGIADLRQGIEACRQVGAELDRPYYLGLLADALLVQGDAHVAFANLAEGIALVRTSRTFFYEAELWRLRGVALLRLNKSLAEESLLEALELARAQDARSLQLRVAINLAEMCLENGNALRGRELLAESYGSFKEGFDCPDLVRAKEVLDVAAGKKLVGRNRRSA